MDTRVTIPRVADEGSLARIPGRRITLNVLDVEAHKAATPSDAVTDAGLSVLYAAYADGLLLRRDLQLAHVALAEAISGDADMITADHVASAYQVD